MPFGFDTRVLANANEAGVNGSAFIAFFARRVMVIACAVSPWPRPASTVPPGGTSADATNDTALSIVPFRAICPNERVGALEANPRVRARLYCRSGGWFFRCGSPRAIAHVSSCSFPADRRTHERTFARRLKLTPQQVEKIAPIVGEATANLEAKREQTGREVRAIFEDMHKRISPLLTPDQQKLLEQMEQRHRQMMHRRGFQPPPPPPHE